MRAAAASARRVLIHPWTSRVLLAVTLISIGWWLAKLIVPLDLSSQPLSWHWLGVAALIQCAYVVGYSLAWHMLSSLTGIRLPLRQSTAIWLFSIFGKYLPGRVLGLATRVALYQGRHERGGLRAGAVCALESVASITGGLITALALAPFCISARALSGNETLLIAFAAALVIAATPFALRVLNWVIRSGGAGIDLGTIRLHLWSMVIASYALLWLVWGTILVAIVAAFDSEVAFRSPWTLVWLYQLAGISGILALFAPSGIGVREGALLAGLLTLLPAPLAALVTVVARLLSMSVEALAIGLGFALLEWDRRLRPQ